MSLVSQYVLRVGAYVIFAMLLEGIMPGGSSKKMVKLMISLVFMYVLIQPVAEWIQQKIPLVDLTTAELEWNAAEANDIGTDYEKQAQAMMGQGYESLLKKQGLPKELKDQYTIVEIDMGDTIEVELARNGEIGGLTDYSLDLGRIGSGKEEEEQILKSLSTYWGVPQEKLEMRLR